LHRIQNNINQVEALNFLCEILILFVQKIALGTLYVNSEGRVRKDIDSLCHHLC
jgi:hypothetical protein